MLWSRNPLHATFRAAGVARRGGQWCANAGPHREARVSLTAHDGCMDTPRRVSAEDPRTGHRRHEPEKRATAAPATGPPHDLGSLQHVVGNQAVLGLLGQPSPAVQRSPRSWAADATVATIGTYDGSRAYWMPVRDLVAHYAGLRGDDLQQRDATLVALAQAVAAWRANQARNWWLSDLDTLKATALGTLDRLIRDEHDDIRAAQQPPQLPRTSAPTGIRGRAGSATTSFEAALENTPPWTELGLIQAVMPTDVDELRDQTKCRVRAAGGVLSTHDGRFRIDTGGTTERYVLCMEGVTPVLYASQALTDADSLRAGHQAMSEYPLLSSHAQISGTVVGAGDFSATGGRITAITNQSGTWRPDGKHLAAVLKLLVRSGIVDEDAFVTQSVPVKLFVSKPDGYDVDGGELVSILGRALSGKLT